MKRFRKRETYVFSIQNTVDFVVKDDFGASALEEIRVVLRNLKDNWRKFKIVHHQIMGKTKNQLETNEHLSLFKGTEERFLCAKAALMSRIRTLKQGDDEFEQPNRNMERTGNNDSKLSNQSLCKAVC